MIRTPLLIGLTLCTLYACGDKATLGTGMDVGGSGSGAGNGGSGGTGGGTGEAGADTGSGGTTMAASGGMASGGKGGASSGAGQGGGSTPSMGGKAGMMGTGGGAAGSSAGQYSEAGIGAMGAGATAGTATSGCRIDTIDTNQGNPPPAAEDCDAIGADLKAAHDEALESQELDVAPLAGTWVGGSGAGRRELVLAADGSGTLRFGEAADFPEIDDPSEPFLTTTGETDASDLFGLAHVKEQPGFAYSVIAESGRASEMSFHITALEAWEGWCALQSPVQSAGGSSCYSCAPDVGLHSLFQDAPSGSCEAAGCYAGDHDPDEANRVHCGLFELCLLPYDRVCHCTADECFANVVGNGQLTFYPFTATLDPFDAAVLRLASLSELQPKDTVYLDKVE